MAFTAKDVQALREKGLASAAKKASRVAAEGIVATCKDETAGILVELNCETDFVGNNPEFKALANQIAKTVVEAKPADVDALAATTVSPCLPSITASAIAPAISLTALIASSLPGIT